MVIAREHPCAEALDLVAEKQHLLGEPHHNFVVARIVLWDEHRLPPLAAELGDDRQRAITLLACPLFMHFVEIEHGIAPNGRKSKRSNRTGEREAHVS